MENFNKNFYIHDKKGIKQNIDISINNGNIYIRSNDFICKNKNQEELLNLKKKYSGENINDGNKILRKDLAMDAFNNMKGEEKDLIIFEIERIIKENERMGIFISYEAYIKNRLNNSDLKPSLTLYYSPKIKFKTIPYINIDNKKYYGVEGLQLAYIKGYISEYEWINLININTIYTGKGDSVSTAESKGIYDHKIYEIIENGFIDKIKKLINILIEEEEEYYKKKIIDNSTKNKEDIIKGEDIIKEECVVKESLRYYNSFVKELQDYKNLSTIEFYQKYIDTKLENEISNEWDLLDDETKNNNKSFKEYKEKYIEDNMDEDNMSDEIREYFDPLDITTYENENNGYFIHEIQLSYGGPNVDITINTRRNTGVYEFHWGGDSLSRNVDKDLVEIYLGILGLDY